MTVLKPGIPNPKIPVDITSLHIQVQEMRPKFLCTLVVQVFAQTHLS